MVRSYECDLQGIVNNAVYQNYLEYARHEFLKEKGIDFVKMHDAGKDLVVVRAELDYKSPLRSDENFYVESTFSREGKIKWKFSQDIIREDGKLMLHAEIKGACLNPAGKPITCEELDLLT